MANSLQNIPQNKWIQSTYDEILHPPVVSEKTGDEIVLEVFAKCGLKLKGD